MLQLVEGSLWVIPKVLEFFGGSERKTRIEEDVKPFLNHAIFFFMIRM